MSRSIYSIFLRIFTLASVLLLLSCQGKEQKKPLTTSTTSTPFSLPTIPPIINGEAERMLYMAEHYWDKLPLQDTALFAQKQTLEQAFANYCALLETLPEELAYRYVKQWMQQLQPYPAWQHKMTDLAAHYLYDAGSPMLNEALYIPFAESALANDQLTDYKKDQLHYRLEVANRNRPGSLANDFRFIREDGSSQHLHQIQAPLLLLIFYDPLCENCQAILNDLQANTLIQSYQQQGILHILMIYTEGDEAVWQSHKKEHPAAWMAAYDQGEIIKKQSLYDLRAMPSLYLLDAQKKVLLKDVLPEKIFAYLAQILS